MELFRSYLSTDKRNKNESIQLRLLQQSSKGEISAFNEFYKQTSPTVYSIALHFLLKESAAENVLEKVYLEIWEKSLSYDPNMSTVKTWIINITMNKVFDELSILEKKLVCSRL